MGLDWKPCDKRDQEESIGMGLLIMYRKHWGGHVLRIMTYEEKKYF